MTFRLLLITFFILTFSSCDNKKIKRVIVDDVIAEGEISNDTVFNGTIKFYDTGTGKLVETANYKAGILDGERTTYYDNGKTKLRLRYDNGKINGEVKIFDSTGGLLETQNLYYDLRVGQSIEYKQGRINQYYFYSLENKELLHIDYDSIQGKKIEQLNDTSFFFWHLNDFSTTEFTKPEAELFLYLPNPPKLNFKYSLCIIDNKYDIKQTVKEFATNISWDTVNLEYSILKTNESFAIKLTVDNDDKPAVMFKRLKYGR